MVQKYTWIILTVFAGYIQAQNPGSIGFMECNLDSLEICLGTVPPEIYDCTSGTCLSDDLAYCWFIKIGDVTSDLTVDTTEEEYILKSEDIDSVGTYHIRRCITCNETPCSYSIDSLCTDWLVLTVKPNPTPQVNPASASICEGSEVILTASGGQSYFWSDSSIEDQITITPLEDTIYTVVVTDTFGCTATKSVPITVSSKPKNPTLDDYSPIKENICITEIDINYSPGSGGKPGFEDLIEIKLGNLDWKPLPDNPFTPIDTGLVVVRSRRSSVVTEGCPLPDWSIDTLFTIYPQPNAGNIILPDGLSGCAGIYLKPEFIKGSGGVPETIIEKKRYSIDGVVFRDFMMNDSIATNIFEDTNGGQVILQSIYDSTESTCMSDTQSVTYIVYPLPAIELTPFIAQVPMNDDREVCQDTPETFWNISKLRGTPPYDIIVNDIDYTTPTSGNIEIPFNTTLPGEVSFEITKIVDSKGCVTFQIMNESVTVLQNPMASIDYSFSGVSGVRPDFIEQNFTLSGDASMAFPSTNKLVSYTWSFQPELYDVASTYPVMSYSDKAGTFRAIVPDTDICLTILDQKNCRHEICDELNVKALPCSLSPVDNVRNFCASGEIEVALKYRYNPPGPGGGLIIGTISCPSCQNMPIHTIIGSPGNQTLEIIITHELGPSLANLVFEIEFSDINSGCETTFMDSLTIAPFPDFLESDFTFPDTICIDSGKDIFEIGTNLPPYEMRLIYEVISPSSTIKDTVLLIPGNSNSFPLTANLVGDHEIKLVKIESISGSFLCGSEFPDDSLKFPFLVIECRHPDLYLTYEGKNRDSTFCINQANMTFKANDKNDYRDFADEVQKQYEWTLWDGNDQIAGASFSKKDSIAYLSQVSTLVGSREYKVRCIITSTFNSGVIFKDTFEFPFTIRDEEAPSLMPLLEFPGHIFYLQDTTTLVDKKLCKRWGYYLSTDLDEEGFLIENWITDNISDNGYAFFGKDWPHLGKLMSINTKGDFEAYLWADTWYEDNGSACIWDEDKCLTRNFFNALLPPEGNSRSASASENETSLFPNPNSGNFQYEITGHWLGKYNISIFDIQGKICYLNTIQKEAFKEKRNIELNQLPPGIYLLHLLSGDGHFTIKRFIIL